MRNAVTVVLLTLWIALSFAGSVSARGDDYRFERLSTADGLPNSIIYSIVQDQTGFIWFGSQDGGLSRYDGKEFLVLTHEPGDPLSVASNNAGQVYQDRQGLLWIGTWGAGLNGFDPVSGEMAHFVHDASDSGSICGNRIQSILQDSRGYIWLATFQGGLCRLDKYSGEVVRYQHDPEDPASLSEPRARTIAEDSEGNIWVSTSRGVDRLDTSSGRFTHFRHHPDQPGSLSHNTVYKVYYSPSGELWAATGRGLDRFDPNSQTFEPVTTAEGELLGKLSTVFEDSRGRLWLGTFTQGLMIYDPVSEQLSRVSHDPLRDDSLSGNDVRAIYEDRSGNIWIGTRGGGISRYNNKPRKFSYFGFDPQQRWGLRNTMLNTLAVDQQQPQHLWLGTREGANLLDTVSGDFLPLPLPEPLAALLSATSVNVILSDQQGRIWFATSDQGLIRFDRQSGTHRSYLNGAGETGSAAAATVIALYQDSGGEIWVGTYQQGLLHYQSQQDSFVRYQHQAGDSSSLSHNQTSTIYEDRGNNLWVATADGLNLMDRHQGTFRRYPLQTAEDQGAVFSPWIYTLLEDSSGMLWLGTKGGGLLQFDPQAERFRRWTTDQGLSSNVITGVLEDEQQRLWLSSVKGLSRLDPVSGEIQHFTVADGLQHAEFSPRATARSPDGRLWFGGINGLNSFVPQQVQDNPHPVEVVLTGFRLFGRTALPAGRVPYLSELELTHEDDYFTLVFAGLEFTAPELNHYAYKLEGFDRDWNPAGPRNEAHYTNLDGGDYIFRVRAANNDGVWNEEALTLPLRISTPPWLTWWAYLLYLLLLMGGIVLLIRWRTRRFEQTIAEQGRVQKLLEQAVAERTQELERLNGQLEQMSNTDSLTGIYNRRYFDDALSREWTRHIRSERPLALVLCDIDCFKPYNDLYGHQAGDNCLKLVAESLSCCGERFTDICARYGGEEFAFILPNTDKAGAIKICQRAQQQIEALAIPHAGSTVKPQISVSFGLVSVEPRQELAYKQMLAWCDEALYRSKTRGRDRITAYAVQDSVVVPGKLAG